MENFASVLDAARRRDVSVLHITASVRGDFRDIPQDNPPWASNRESKAMIYGTAGAEIRPTVAPLDSELVLNETCVDPFLTTGLGQALRNADANALILMGLWTNYVVEATARHASDMGDRVFIVRECCAGNNAENHDFAMDRILPTLSYVVSLEETLQTLS